jgi:hypothetical protein
MTLYLNPILCADTQFFNDKGVILSGGLIHTYLAGSTTPVPSYTSNTGSTFNPNPIVLNAAGRLPAEVWLTGGFTYKFVVQDSAGSPITPGTFDNISGINDPSGSSSSITEWIVTGFTPIYSTGATFLIAGDLSGTLTVNRRLQITQTGGVVYGYVSAVSYNAGTNKTSVTVSVDSSGSLNSGISVVNYALLNSINVSVPQQIVSTTQSNVIFSNAVTAGALVGNLTGNVTGNVTGSVASVTTATTATNASQLGGIAAANWWGNNQSYSGDLGPNGTNTRLASKTYTNSSGRSIWVMVSIIGGGSPSIGYPDAQVLINSVQTMWQMNAAGTTLGTSKDAFVGFPVPNGATYGVFPFNLNVGIDSWFEYA